MKPTRTWWAGAAAVTVLAALAGGCGQPRAEAPQSPPPVADGVAEAFTYALYAEALAAYVDDDGGVDYAGLKQYRAGLDAFAAALGALSPDIYAAWGDQEQLAFWINAYNGLTLKLIIDHYPIKSSALRSIAYPKNSIRQIPGAWDKVRFRVMGRDMTLNEIEHDTIRKDFGEPRIHAALVCAAKGCPPLRNEPFEGAKLEEQLHDQMRKFLAYPGKLRIGRENGRVYVSQIFDWYGADFIGSSASDVYVEYDAKDRAILDAVEDHVSEPDRQWLRSSQPDINYLDYDWSLNEQTGGGHE